MKCILCDGKVKQQIVEHKEFGISLGRFKALQCEKCGEVFFESATVDQIQKRSKELGLFGLVKKTKVARVGNSLAIRIPKDIAEFIHLKKEEEVKIIPQGPKELRIEIS